MDVARFGSRIARDVVEVRRGGHQALRDLTPGFWAVVVTFEGHVTAVRFDRVASAADPAGAVDPAGGIPAWRPLTGRWRSSLDKAEYVGGVREIRDRVAAGTVYQVNLCRTLSHPVEPDVDLTPLDTLLSRGNPAPHDTLINVPDAGLRIACASPETFLLRDGSRISSRPIKGTAPSRRQMLAKDYAENVMIVDLVRNDLHPVCVPGTVAVDHLCVAEEHPGLVHLVSQVSGRLADEADWPEIMAAAYPPGSVSGAPKSTALAAIADLEPVERGPYCGAIGWVDTRDPERSRAELAVGIRTFWVQDDDTSPTGVSLRFGTGAGITWGSDPLGEWEETELKAARLIGLVSGTVEA